MYSEFRTTGPFWFTVDQDLVDSSPHRGGRVYESMEFEQCDYTFSDWGWLLVLVLFLCVVCFVFLRGGGEREMPGRTKCDVCEHPCAHSIGLKASLLWPLN